MWSLSQGVWAEFVSMFVVWFEAFSVQSVQVGFSTEVVESQDAT